MFTAANELHRFSTDPDKVPKIKSTQFTHSRNRSKKD